MYRFIYRIIILTVSFNLGVVANSSVCAQNPEFDWGLAAADQGSGLNITLSHEGFLYVAATFVGAVELNTNLGNVQLVSAGATDILILKLDTSNGHIVWAKSLGGPGFDGSDYDNAGNPIPQPMSVGIITGLSGNVYLAGSFSDSIDCDPSESEFWLKNDLEFAHSTFITKLTADGDFLWAKKASTSDSEVRSVNTDSSGNLYLTGRLRGTVDMDPSTEIIEFVTNGSYDAFVQKLTANGELLWARQLTSDQDADGQSVVVNHLGQTVVTGSFKGLIDLDPDPGSESLHVSSDLNPNASGLFMVMLDPDGNLIWDGSIENAGGGSYSPTALDEQDNIYLSHGFTGQVDVDFTTDSALVAGNGTSTFLCKYDRDGELNWSKVFTTGVGVSSIDVYSERLIVGGSFGGGAFIHSTVGDTLLNFDASGYMMELDTTGTIQWVRPVSNGIFTDVRGIRATEESIYATGFSLHSPHSLSPEGIPMAFNGNVFVLKWTSFITGNATIPEQTLKGVRVYPNPAQSGTVVEMVQNCKEGSIALYDMYGQSIMNMLFAGNRVRIGTDILPSGVYLLKITCEKNVSAINLVIQQ